MKGNKTMNKILEILSVVVITKTVIPSIIAPNPSTLKEIEEEIKRLKQEQEEDYRQAMIDYQVRLHKLDEMEQTAKRDRIYNGDLKEHIQQARKKVIDDYNKLFAMHNQNDITVGIDALEVEDFDNNNARSISAVRMSSDDQPGTSGIQNVLMPQNSSISDAETTVTLGENNINNPSNFISFNS